MDNSYLQKFLAIGGRASSAIESINKGYYQKAKNHLEKIVEISNKEIEELRETGKINEKNIWGE